MDEFNVDYVKTGFARGTGKDDPNINHDVVAGDSWWAPMSDDEAEAFIEGRS